MSSPPPSDVRRVVVTRLKFLGDVVLSTPVLHALRRALPEAQLEFVTLADYAPVLERHPDLDALHLLPAGAGPVATARLARALRRPRVDWWIDLLGSPRSALLAALSRPRLAVGPDRGLRSRVFQERCGRPGGDRSAVRHHLHKLSALLGEVDVTPVRTVAAPEWVEAGRAILDLRAGEAPLLLHPGSTWQSTAWPPVAWARLAALLAREGRGPLLLVDAPNAPGVAAAVAAQSSVPLRVLPPLPLRTLLGVMAQSALYVGNDGGVLHAAIGLGVPTVGIFGPTETDIWFPHPQAASARVVQQPVPCRPCHLHACSHLTCLRTLQPQTVLAAIHDALGAPAEAQAPRRAPEAGGGSAWRADGLSAAFDAARSQRA